MDEIHVHKTKKSICAHFAESPCKSLQMLFLLSGSGTIAALYKVALLNKLNIVFR